MKSITIHDMDPVLAERLQRQARESGLSLNKSIKGLLASALGIESARSVDRRRHFADLCGIWSKQDARAFQKSIASFERIDPEDWR